MRYLVDTTLGRTLYGTANGQPDGEPLTGETRKTSQRDPRPARAGRACGSGSFLIYAYEVLAEFYRERDRAAGSRDRGTQPASWRRRA